MKTAADPDKQDYVAGYRAGLAAASGSSLTPEPGFFTVLMALLALGVLIALGIGVAVAVLRTIALI